MWMMHSRTHATAAEESAPTPDLTQFRQYWLEGPPGPHYYAVLLGLQTFDWPHLMQLIEDGVPFRALEHLQENVGLAPEAFSDWIQIAPRTLTRRRQEGRLQPEESDRLFRAARIFARALELFEGDRTAALDWLLTGQPALGGGAPIEVSRTELGAREVENLIGRVEHGIYS